MLISFDATRRNSLQYEGIYGIWGAATVLRGTLRYRGFCLVMRALQHLGLFSLEADPLLIPEAPAQTWVRAVYAWSLLLILLRLSVRGVVSRVRRVPVSERVMVRDSAWSFPCGVDAFAVESKAFIQPPRANDVCCVCGRGGGVHL